MPSGTRRSIATVPLAPREVEKRINAEALLGGTRYPVSGWARFGHVRLRRARFIRWFGQPLLTGRIEPAGEGSRLTLRFGRPPSAYVALTIWYSFLSLLTLRLSFGNWSPGIDPGEKILAFLFLSVFWLLPIVWWFDDPRWEQELATLTAFLEQHVGATLVAAPEEPEANGGTGR